MKKTHITMASCALILLLLTTGCNAEKEGEKVTIEEPGGSITIVNKVDNETEEPGISIVRIDNYEQMEISGWTDSDTVIVSKENETLDKMKLEELSDFHPESLYLYNLDTKEYKLLKEEEELNLGGATLSPDKRNLIYYGSSLGDLSYSVLNLEDLESFSISAAGSANWFDKDTVIGAGYSNGAYYATTEGEITAIDELAQESIYIVEKIKDRVYYNTQYDNSLMILDLSTKEIVSLDIPNVSELYLAPDKNQMLVLNSNGPKQNLLLFDKDGSNVKTIAEGVELGGVSWSPEQRMIAYTMKGDGSGTAVNGLYIYDMLTGKSTQIAVDIWNAVTNWSPSGEELVYTQWDGKHSNSSIVYLEYSLQK